MWWSLFGEYLLLTGLPRLVSYQLSSHNTIQSIIVQSNQNQFVHRLKFAAARTPTICGDATVLDILTSTCVGWTTEEFMMRKVKYMGITTHALWWCYYTVDRGWVAYWMEVPAIWDMVWQRSPHIIVCARSLLFLSDRW